MSMVIEKSILKNGEFKVWKAKFKILNLKEDAELEGKLTEYMVSIFNESEVKELEKLEKHASYLTDDKRYLIKRKTNNKYNVYETKELIKKGVLYYASPNLEKIFKYKKISLNMDEGEIINTLYRKYGIRLKDNKEQPINNKHLNDILTWLNKFNDRYKGLITKNPYKLFNIYNSHFYYGELDVDSFIALTRQYDFGADIYLNGEYYNRMNILQDFVQYGAETGFYPHNYSMKDIFIHEFGHYIDKSIAYIKQDKNWFVKFLYELKIHNVDFRTDEDYVKNNIGIYAAKNKEELFAELFTEYFSFDNPRRMATLFGEKLDKLLKELPLLEDSSKV